jgi:tetratricopeptide (TPR) repeat protein
MLEDLIISLDKMNEKLAAVAVLDALARNSTMFVQYDEVARCYFKIKEYKKSYENAEKALALAPTNSYEAKYNVINAANHANYPERALTLISQLELIKPKDIELKLEKAFAHFMMNQKDKAEKLLREELENPKNSDEIKTRIRFNLGTYEMMRDEFLPGLKKFLLEGRKLDLWKKPNLPFIYWNGRIVEGATLVIRAEAGIGDEFINVRFMKHLRDKGMNPVWLTEREDIAHIFNRNGFDTVSSVKEVKDKNAYWTHSMDLPFLLNLEYKDLWYGQYLFPDKSIELPKELSTKKLKIGLRWQGNFGYDQDLHRSISLTDMFNAVKDFDADLFSIQKDSGLDELKDLPIIDLDKYMTDYEQTLAIIGELDVVITSCTSVAHASAIMGKRTFVMVPISSYYVWCHSMKQSPWYGDNVTILRQQKPREWTEPLSELKKIIESEYKI